MTDAAPDYVRIFLTQDPLALGRIPMVMAQIKGDVAEWKSMAGDCYVRGEGRSWHRTRWAAQNYACSLRNERLRTAREEVDRLERMDFGVKW